jgi:ABC-type glycerol-3-phosphate transport system substrate-binding protein
MFYNERLLKKYHLKPATTWNELYAQGVKMKKAGFSSPIVPVWTTKFDLTHAIFICDCISRGMHSQFDKNLNPLWDKNPIALQVLEYWHKLQAAHLIPADALTIDHHQSSSIMQAGQGVYFWFNSYELANLNKTGTSKEAGHIRAAMMPDTHYTSTFTASTYQSKTHSREEAWPLTRFIAGYDKNGHIGGPVTIAAAGVGSLPGYKSALKDPRVKKAWKAWSNTHDLQVFSKQLAHAAGEGPILNTSWYPQYNDFMAKMLSQYLAGEITAKAALKTGADYVRSIKK